MLGSLDTRTYAVNILDQDDVEQIVIVSALSVSHAFEQARKRLRGGKQLSAQLTAAAYVVKQTATNGLKEVV